jgi:hypothetical protein
MKFTSLKIVLLLLLYFIILGLFTGPCDALDLDNDSIYEKMIESIDTEPENWLLRDGQLYYISSGAGKIKNDSYPEFDKNCTVHIYYRVLVPHKQVYVKVEKPGEFFIEGKMLDKFANKIRQFMLKELKEQYKVKEESIIKPKPTKMRSTDQSKKSGMEEL